jgi:outer membrane protein assembly factor BamD (BamD/ComL family)
MANSIVSKNMEPNVVQLPLADRLWDWFETYKRQIAWGFGILLVAGLVIWFIVWQQETKQIDAGTALSQVAANQLDGVTAGAQTADAYLKVARDYPNSICGARALLLGAAGLFTEGKYSDAQVQFERFIREYQGSPFMGEALFGVAACLDAQNKSEQAITAYKDLIMRHPKESFVPQAKFALARLDEAQNKPELARDLYQDIERAAPFSPLGNEAGVRLEELVAKYPKLAPAPPSPSASALTNLAPLLEKK